MIYAIWWNKPLDIEERQVIIVRDKDDEAVIQALAYMCVNSKLERQRPLTSAIATPIFLVPVEIDKTSGSGHVLPGVPIENHRRQVRILGDKSEQRVSGGFFSRLW